uniref:protein-tyrosine-phosphatase n=1 Tax=Setaria italica TaxID=4555 RepID=K3Y935_SETIT
MPHLVRERLYFGDIKDAIAALTDSSSTPTFTHVLSVVSSASISFITDCRPGLAIPTEEVRRVVAGEEGAPPTAAVPPGTLMRVEENLLDHLEPCLDFIDDGRKVGNVLVHCFAGVSMRSEQKPLEEALESLKEISELACPNDGFLEQLKLFGEMGFKVDTSSPLYKRFRLKLLDPSKTEQHKTAYRCRKCRRIIAVEDNVISHVPGEGESCFDWNRRKSGHSYSNKEQDCSSLFIEPLKWMTPVKEGALEGKLSCIHCGARLGYYPNWSGIQCNCGSWVTPAFQIVKSKVDISTI